MFLVAITAAAFVAGCQNSARDQALIEKAQETAFMPECASLRVKEALQAQFPDDPELGNVVVTYRSSSQCMDEWAERLRQTGWSLEHHGSWSSPDGNIFASPNRADRANEGSVIWFQRNLEPGVRDLTQELSR